MSDISGPNHKENKMLNNLARSRKKERDERVNSKLLKGSAKDAKSVKEDDFPSEDARELLDCISDHYYLSFVGHRNGIITINDTSLTVASDIGKAIKRADLLDLVGNFHTDVHPVSGIVDITITVAL